MEEIIPSGELQMNNAKCPFCNTAEIENETDTIAQFDYRLNTVKFLEITHIENIAGRKAFLCKEDLYIEKLNEDNEHKVTKIITIVHQNSNYRIWFYQGIYCYRKAEYYVFTLKDEYIK